jgi:hypothetical protein
MFEPMRADLEARMVPLEFATVPEIWEGKNDPYLQFCDLVEQVLKDDTVDCVTVDGTDLYYRAVSNSYCAYKKVLDPKAMNDFGASWDRIDELFNAPLHQLRKANKGVILISHSAVKDVETIDGTVIEVVNPALTGRALKIVKEMCGIVLYYGHFPGQRGAIRVRDFEGKLWCSVGPKNRFMQPNGKPLEMFGIPDNSQKPGLGFETLNAAFNNQVWDLNTSEEEKEGKERKQVVRRK